MYSILFICEILRFFFEFLGSSHQSSWCPYLTYRSVADTAGHYSRQSSPLDLRNQKDFLQQLHIQSQAQRSQRMWRIRQSLTGRSKGPRRSSKTIVVTAPVHRSGKRGLWDDENTQNKVKLESTQEVIKRINAEVLQQRTQQRLGDASVHISGKGVRNPLSHELSQPPPQTFRMGQSVKAVSNCANCAKAMRTNLDDNFNRSQGDLMQVDVRELRFSQRSCKERFQCGRGVIQLVQDLWDGKVRLTDPFLCLTVFETTDKKTGQPILRCIDNRRLYALKEYAELCGDDDEIVMVNINLYSEHTIKQVKRFIWNTDVTDGFVVRLRKSREANATKGNDVQHRRGNRGRRGRRGLGKTRRSRRELWSKRSHWNSCIAESTIITAVIFIGMKWSQSDPGFCPAVPFSRLMAVSKKYELRGIILSLKDSWVC